LFVGQERGREQAVPCLEEHGYRVLFEADQSQGKGFDLIIMIDVCSKQVWTTGKVTELCESNLAATGRVIWLDDLTAVMADGDNAISMAMASFDRRYKLMRVARRDIENSVVLIADKVRLFNRSDYAKEKQAQTQ